jgi:hypothetical protein
MDEGKEMESYKVDFDSLSWQSQVQGCRYKMLQQGNRKLRLVEFSREFIELDWCTKGHIGYVLEGEGKIYFTNCSIELMPGNGIFIPGGIENKHKLHVTSNKITLILVEEE